MSEYSRVYKDKPELWDEGLSFLAKVEYSGGNQRIIASGWHKRQIEFENQLVEFQDTATGESTIDLDEAQEKTVEIWDDVLAYEIEVALNAHHFEEAVATLSHLVEESLAKQLVESVSTMIQRVSANKIGRAHV